MLDKQCIYDNMNLDCWDIVLIDDWRTSWLRLGMIKTSYHDWKTDCSWHYIKVSSSWEILDLCWDEIIYKLTWPDAEILRSYILDWEILEDKELWKAKIINDIKYYQEKIRSNEASLKMNKEWLEDTLKEYKEFTWEDFIL